MNGKQPIKDSAQSSWDAYWRDGRISACREDSQGLYRGVIRDHWRSYFSAQVNKTLILDLAAGNGALAAIAYNDCQALFKRLTIIGVDRAQLGNGMKLLRGGKIVNAYLLGGVKMEQLPFIAGKFDAVISQYGVEYGEFALTIPEVSRVIKHGGEICWVCHWAAGAVAQNAEKELADAKRLLALELSKKTIQLLQLQVKGTVFKPSSHSLTAKSRERNILDQALNYAFAILQTGGYPPGSNLHVYMNNLGYIYQHRERHSLPVVVETLRELHRQLQYHKIRLQQLKNAALTRTRRDEIISLLSLHGFRGIKHGEMREINDEQVVAYRITAVKV